MSSEVTKKPTRAPYRSGDAFGILNRQGTFWTHRTFESERSALEHLEVFWRGSKDIDLARDFEVIPVNVTVRDARAQGASNVE